MKFKAIYILSTASLFLLLAACGSNNEGQSPATLVLDQSGGRVDAKLVVLDIAGSTERVSTDSAGIQADQNSINSALSADGQIVVFDSTSTNLVANDSNVAWDIFAKNRRDGSTRRLSVATDGSQANGDSTGPKVSSDGRYVVFASDATNLVLNDNNTTSDIFLHDTLTSITTLISKNSSNEPANGASETPNISADGRYIVFVSQATNLSSLDNTISKDVYVHDRVNTSTTLVSVDVLGELGNDESITPDISADGNHIVFASSASNLVANDNNAIMDVFLKVMSDGSMMRVSTNSAGIEANGLSDTPSISSDGNVVAYRSTATNIADNISVVSKQIYAKDLVSGLNEVVSLNNIGEVSNAGSFFSTSISAAGQYIVFYTEADNLDPLDTNGTWDVFLRDRVRQITRLVSVNSLGEIGNGNSFLPAVNEYGSYVSFGSSSTNFIADDSNGSWDIYVHVIVPMNLTPIADAGIDQEVPMGTVVQLDGSLSYDPDATPTGPGPVSGYLWQVVSAPLGSNATLSDPVIVMPTFTPDMAGVYVFALTVNDGELDSIPASMTLTISANLAPIANISIDVSTGPQPLTVQVDGSASSDPEGDLLNYFWDFDDPQSGSENNSTLISATHIYKNAGSYSIVLTVSDSFGNQSQVFTRVDVIAVNNPPEILSMADVYAGPAPLTVQFKANASDPDGDALTYLWDFDSTGNQDTNNISVLADPVHTFSVAGTYLVSLSVSDGQLATSTIMTIVVESALLLNVEEAVIAYEHDDIVNGKVWFEATLPSAINGTSKPIPLLTPDSGGRVVVQVDDMVLVDVPLASFTRETDSDGSDELVYREDYLKVEIDPRAREFEFRAERLLLTDKIDYANGVDFIVRIGNDSAIENVVMQKQPSVDCDRHRDHKDDDYKFCGADNSASTKLIYRSSDHH